MTHDHRIIEAWCENLRITGRATNTIRGYRIAMRQAAGHLPQGLAATTDELATWLASYTAQATRSCYGAAARSLYRWAVKARQLDLDPTTDLDVPPAPVGVPRPCTDEQLRQILATVVDPLRLWSLLASYAGARCIEISRLHREHVTAERVTLTGKGGRTRRVPTHPQLWAVVEPLPPGPVAGSAPGTISGRLCKAYRRAGVDVTPHQLRHWAGTRWQAATGDIRVTQELMGHSSPAVTQVYCEPSAAAMAAAVAALPVLT